MYTATTATHKIVGLTKRIQGVAGGTSASKTISNLLKLINMAQEDTVPTLTSIVSESLPHLRRGAMRDFLNIMTQHHYYNDDMWNRTEFIYTFPSGSKIEFFSADQPSKTRGPRRERLFINEGNNIPWEAADQMIVRTRDLIIVDWNPTNEFWWYTEIAPHRDHDFITLTYKDNEALDPAIVEDIESHKHNKAWWQVYGLGQLGEVEGKIYKDWKIIDEVPHNARLERRGLDFGYSNDPTVLVDVYVYNGGYILDEVIYRKGMHNKDIADRINAQPNAQILVIADSAEPKSIDEIQNYGVNILGAEKGKGSVTRGIDWVQMQRISITKRSPNLIKSYRNYMWATDKEGTVLNVPDHFWSDGMDAVRYALETFRPKEDDLEPFVTGNLSSLWK